MMELRAMTVDIWGINCGTVESCKTLGKIIRNGTIQDESITTSPLRPNRFVRSNVLR